jgi:hypothetical protein
MSYPIIKLNYVPRLREEVPVRTGPTEEKAVESLESAIGIRDIRHACKIDEKIVVYKTDSGWEAVLLNSEQIKHLREF